jgi:DNA invertase Pin-like site-specific DNA recombinase
MKAQTTHGEKVADTGMRFAFYGRVSTEDNQDPTLSLPRQLANCERAVAEAGGRIVAHFYDVESGAVRLEGRGSGKGLVGFDIPIPRDGGLVDLIEDASSGGFDAVVCESINRLSRNPSVTFRVEEQLAEEGVRLWAIDEPFEESFGSIVLRHANVGLARGYLHELKVKSRQGIETAAKQGRHAGGKPLYGYRFSEHEHPNPHKAPQGLKVKVLEPDPIAAQVVKMIFHDYVVNGLTITELVRKLNSDLERYPPPQSPDPKRRTGMWGRSSVWEILHNPKYTGYQVWNRRQRKRGGKINPPDKWIWSEEPAHEPLVTREMFDRANATAVKRDNVTKAAEGHADYRKHTYVLRSFLKCALCGLRMHGKRRRGRNYAYYTCEVSRRHSGLVPEDHPRMVYLREDKAGEKVVEFLATHLFGPDRVEALRKSLTEVGPEADHAEIEAERLRSELDGVKKRIRRLVTNLEAQEPDSEIAEDIRARLDELAGIRAKKLRALEAAYKEAAQVPDPKSAEALVGALPLLDVDWGLVSDQDFRDLLAALNFEASYDATKRELTIRVTLVPELTSPDGGRAPLLSVPPARHSLHLCRNDLESRTAS